MFVVAGESLVDLVAEDGGRFTAHAGGSPFNCARALARLGHETGFLCPISVDGFGDLLLKRLIDSGAVALLGERSRCNTTLAVVTRNAKGLPAYGFYRNGTAERDLVLGALLAALPERLELLQIGGFLPVEAEDFAVWLPVVEEAARRGAVIAIDPNVRPALIGDFEGYRARLGRFLDMAQVIKVSDEDIAALEPGREMSDVAREWLGRGRCRLVVVTRGAEGAEAFSGAHHVRVGARRLERFGDTVGAGDTLMAGVLSALAERGLLDGERLGAMSAREMEEVLAFGVVAAGLNCMEAGCNPPTRAEVLAAVG